MDRTRAGNASLLLAGTPILTAVFSALAGHERLSGRVWLGVCGAVLGMVLIVASGGGEMGFGGETLSGDLILIGASVAWSLYTVGARNMIDEYGPTPVTAWTLSIGSLGLVLLGIPELARLDWGAVPAAAWGGVVYAGALGIGLAYLIWNTAVHRIGNTRTATYSNLVPAVALLVAWASLGEQPHAFQIVGAGVIIGGISLARTSSGPSVGAGGAAACDQGVRRGRRARHAGADSWARGGKAGGGEVRRGAVVARHPGVRACPRADPPLPGGAEAAHRVPAPARAGSRADPLPQGVQRGRARGAGRGDRARLRDRRRLADRGGRGAEPGGADADTLDRSAGIRRPARHRPHLLPQAVLRGAGRRGRGPVRPAAGGAAAERQGGHRAVRADAPGAPRGRARPGGCAGRADPVLPRGADRRARARPADGEAAA